MNKIILSTKYSLKAITEDLKIYEWSGSKGLGKEEDSIMLDFEESLIYELPGDLHKEDLTAEVFERLVKYNPVVKEYEHKYLDLKITEVAELGIPYFLKNRIFKMFEKEDCTGNATNILKVEIINKHINVDIAKFAMGRFIGGGGRIIKAIQKRLRGKYTIKLNAK